jgi:hypothetical protein
MPTKQGDAALLDEPVAQELLRSNKLAHLAYVWTDGTPRVIPIWFQWTGDAVVFSSPLNAPKLHALSDGTKVALTIDTDNWPYHVLMIRGTVRMQVVDGVVPEYASAAERYFGPEQGKAWVANVRQMAAQQVRLAVTPEWVGILDFEQRFPSAIAAAMHGA